MTSHLKNTLDWSVWLDSSQLRAGTPEVVLAALCAAHLRGALRLGQPGCEAAEANAQAMLDQCEQETKQFEAERDESAGGRRWCLALRFSVVGHWNPGYIAPGAGRSCPPRPTFLVALLTSSILPNCGHPSLGTCTRPLRRYVTLLNNTLQELDKSLACARRSHGHGNATASFLNNPKHC